MLLKCYYFFIQYLKIKLLKFKNREFSQFYMRFGCAFKRDLEDSMKVTKTAVKSLEIVRRCGFSDVYPVLQGIPL
jgi:hypothetical protein